MRARTFARIGTALAGAAISTLAFAGAAQAASGTIMVPDDFNPAYSGHPRDRTLRGRWGPGCASGPRAPPAPTRSRSTWTPRPHWPTSASRHWNYTTTSGHGIPPGYQLIVDFDNDGTADGILVGEPGFYGTNWWLNNAAKRRR